jgi:hypothetical protein
MATGELPLNAEVLQERRSLPEPTQRVIFHLAGLYGISEEGTRLPLNEHESIESGPVALTLDPDAPQSNNLGIIDFDERKLRVRYGVQCVFPGLYDLVERGEHDRRLLQPIRAVATDDCQVSEDYSGWRALGRLDFLPGSVWSGAGGG